MNAESSKQSKKQNEKAGFFNQFYGDTNTFKKEKLLARCYHNNNINACNTTSYKQSQKAYISLHLPLFDGHLKYLLNFSTKVTKLEVVLTNNPS